MTNSLMDGLGYEEIGQPGSQVSSIWVTGSIYSQSNISGANVYAGTSMKSEMISGTNVYGATTVQVAGRAVSAIGTGSPTTWGMYGQTGTIKASNVAVWGVFGTAFTGSPSVHLTLNESGAAATDPGCVTEAGPGSFSILGQSGLTYNYLALK